MLKKKGKQYLVYLLLVPLVLLFWVFRPAVGETPKHYTELEFPELAEITIPDYQKFELDNGLKVVLMEDHELPLTSGIALVRTGDRLEPADKVGLANITGDVMRRGGTKLHGPDELNQLLERRAASVETNIGTTSGSASFNALSEDLEDVFGLFAEVLREPRFSQDKLDLAKNQIAGAIARRNDDPKDIASREFNKLIYGKQSPYARTIEYATLDRIDRQDLIDFHQKYFHPNNMLLGIVGDFDSKKMKALVEENFGDWKSDPNIEAIDQLPSALASPAKPGGVFFVDRPQLTQSNVQVGHIGGQLDSPDYPALAVMNGVLNGFGGRLFNNVRSAKGLAYSVYAVWSPRYDYPGVFLAGAQTRSEATVPLIEAIRAEIDRIRNEPISAAELEYAKDSTLNSFVFNFQDSGRILSRILRYEYYGYPENFIFQYQRGIEATTIEDVQRVARKYLDPAKIVTLVVGNAAEIQPPLSSLGPETEVTSIDVSIPQPQNS